MMLLGQASFKCVAVEDDNRNCLNIERRVIEL